MAVFTFQPLWSAWEDRWQDWRISTLPRPQQQIPILLLAMAPTPVTMCASHGIDHGQLARVLEALHEAQAAVVAPIFPEPAWNAADCRDPLGEAQFMHALKQTGFVIVQDAAPSVISTHAHRIGHAVIPRDADGIARRVELQTTNGHTAMAALGLAIAQAVDARIARVAPPFGMRPAPRLRYAGRWMEQPFSSLSVSTLSDLTASKRWDELTGMVQGAAVLLFSLDSDLAMLRTPEDAAVPEAFYHANVAYTALTDGWIWEPTAGFTTCVVFVFATAMGWAGLTLTWRRSIVVLVLVSSGFSILAVWLAPFMGFILPFLTVFTGQIVGVGSGMAWSAFATTRGRLSRAEQCLNELKARLAQKESAAARLQHQLVHLQQRIHESVEQVHALETAAATARSQWEAAQQEVAHARKQVQNLEDKIRQFRPVADWHTTASADPSKIVDDPFITECAALGIMTRDPHVLRELRNAKKAASARHPILLLGETGTGKEVLAAAIHHMSPWPQGPFVPVNMTAVKPELFESELFGHVKGAFTGAMARQGLIESARGGTLFMDEVGDLGLDLQAKLLRVIETGTFYRVGASKPTSIDIRLVAATNRDLAHDVAQGRFRADLYYRLKSIVITLPPLRERNPEDLRVLTSHFLARLSPPGRTFTLSEGAWQAIRGHAWPGNVRELRQTLAQAIALAPSTVLTEEDLRLSSCATRAMSAEPISEPPPHAPLQEPWAQWEDEHVVRQLRQCRFDMKATAAALGWDRSTVTQRLKGIGLREIVTHHGSIESAAMVLAGDRSLAPLVEAKLREYHHNLMNYARHVGSLEEALTICRRRLKNLPERHFHAVEALMQQAFLRKSTDSVSTPSPS